MERIERARKSLNKLNLDAVIVTRDSNRRYLTDFTGSNGIIVISQDRAVMITDYRYEEQASLQSEHFEIILHAGHTGHKGSKSTIYKEVLKVLDEIKVERVGFEQDYMFYGLYDLLNKNSDFELVPTMDFVEDIRMIKTEREIKLLKDAATVADKTYLHILDYVKAGMTEIEMAEEMAKYIESQGMEVGHIAVQSGYRAAQAHGRPTDKVIENGEMIVVDFGAANNGYRSDMCRTFAVGEPSEKMKEIYDVVLQSLSLCLKELKAGMWDQEADKIMKDYIYSKGYEGFEGTGTGHGLGLDTHEIPYLSKKRDKQLQAGMVLAVEPGIYLKGEGGVRIEDNLLITEDGHENWTTSSKELIIL